MSICAKDSGGPYSYEVVGKLIDAAQREKLVRGWHKAVGRSQDWAEHEV